MSEKRFTEEYDEKWGIYLSDNMTGDWYNINPFEIVDTCNTLWEQVVKLREENEQLRQTMQKVCELLEEEVDLFSDEATEHDIIAYSEMKKFDNKDAYYICTATKKAIQMLKGRDSDE